MPNYSNTGGMLSIPVTKEFIIPLPARSNLLMKMHYLTWHLVSKALFKNDAFPVNGMPVKLVEKAGMSKSQNKEEGAITIM